MKKEFSVETEPVLIVIEGLIRGLSMDDVRSPAWESAEKKIKAALKLAW